jgi:hypothetical protein
MKRVLIYITTILACVFSYSCTNMDLSPTDARQLAIGTRLLSSSK